MSHEQDKPSRNYLKETAYSFENPFAGDITNRPTRSANDYAKTVYSFADEDEKQQNQNDFRQKYLMAKTTTQVVKH
jgi:hypothetical protein